jgi:transposase
LKPDQDICELCGSKLVKISEKITYKIEIIKQDFKVIKYVKENYKIYYPISNFVFPNSVLTNLFASFIAMYRYDLGIPFDHLSKHISTQIGIPVSKQCLANYMSRLSELFLPIYERMKTDLIHNNEKVIHADETTLVISKKPTEDKNRQKCYIFLYSSSFYGNQINVYDFKKSRNSSALIEFLDDFNGTVVCDDYAGYDTLIKQNKNIKLQRCWAHVRRRFADIVKVVPKGKESSSNAIKILKLIEQLFNFEKIYLENKQFNVDIYSLVFVGKKEECIILANRIKNLLRSENSKSEIFYKIKK